MLKIKKGQINLLVVTATELTTVSNPIFLWTFTHLQSNEEVLALLNNESMSTERFDEFVFEEGVDLTLPYEGQYTYKIIEQQTGVVLEIGRAEVTKALPSDNDYSNGGIDTIYNGGIEN